MQENKEYMSNTGSYEEFNAYKKNILQFTNNYKSFPNRWRRGYKITKDRSEYFRSIEKHFDDWAGRTVLYYEVRSMNWRGHRGEWKHSSRSLQDFNTDEILAR